MKRVASLLESEVLTWPGVTSRPMFGMEALYRGPRIFAALPHTRGMDTANSIAFKLSRPSAKIRSRMKKDPRLLPSPPGAKWLSFELESDEDIREALFWLDQAWRMAR